MLTVAVYGSGQLGTEVARLLQGRGDVAVVGPEPRSGRVRALEGGADVVVIATTTRLADVVGDVEAAVRAGSNVIVSAEESAFPWAVDRAVADSVDELARAHGVTVVGGGLNPGLIFDALVLTLMGTFAEVPDIEVRRTVDIGGFGPAVLARLGVGFAPDEFERRVAAGDVLGHAGFPQSMSIVAGAVGLTLDDVVATIEPLSSNGRTVGVLQRYVGWARGRPWFSAEFEGHVDPDGVGLRTRDELVLSSAQGELRCALTPGVNAQAGSSSMVANSVWRVASARPGWLTVADLPPAFPSLARS